MISFEEEVFLLPSICLSYPTAAHEPEQNTEICGVYASGPSHFWGESRNFTRYVPAEEYALECNFLKVKSLINVSTFLGDSDWEF